MKKLLAAKPDIDKLLPTGAPDEYEDKGGEVDAVANLPSLSAESAVTESIKLVLEWSMAIALVAIIVAAIYYIIGRGKEEDISKAKDILFYLVIGMAIMSAAYGIIAGIAQFEFFE